ncbi:MAG: tRNA 5-methoxyuridine(34)/uridine 5-oxyacetic acid(34) synthase CmoB [Cardiobacteriaceae bacterium]|nr:tRNA 5-methoxyuridine(34)/uridine 5-oxyacetic acid(34) synthase CmoB [Cardiobacteriaceae bacterium]
MNPALAQWQHAVALKKTLVRQDAVVRAALEQTKSHGHFSDWLSVVESLPALTAMQTELNEDVVRVSGVSDAALESKLRALQPWRKGPFSLYGVDIDSEWRSNLKFSRLLAAGIDFSGKHVLDVGCGNGYFLYRMLGAGASLALGIDPSWHYFAQYLALEKLIGVQRCAYLPLTLDDFSPTDFDITLSMGMLYHRRDPLQHLAQLRDSLRSGGLLVLETLVVAGDAQTVLMPMDRYAGMRNVWFLPSPAALGHWLLRLGFIPEYIGDPIATTREEQRSTTWIDRYSLADFMNEDFSLTVEGLPPPQRLIIIARKKGA